MNVERWLDSLERLEIGLADGGPIEVPPLNDLAGYYAHLADLAKGYEKDPDKLKENLALIHEWQNDTISLSDILSDKAPGDTTQ